MRDIQHALDLVPGSQLFLIDFQIPSTLLLFIGPKEHAELNRQVEELLAKGST